MKYENEWTEIIFNHRDPPYLQIIRHFKELITIDKLQVGHIIPSRCELGHN